MMVFFIKIIDIFFWNLSGTRYFQSNNYSMEQHNLTGMKKLILLLLFLILGVHSLSVMQYGFPFDPAQDPTAGRFNAYALPTYPLGTLSVGTSINVKINIPNPLSYQISDFSLELLQEVTGGFAAVTITPSYITSTSLEFNYDVVFPSQTVLSGEYWLRIMGPDPTIEVDYYYLEVTSYRTASGLSVGNMQTLLKLVDVMRSTILKYIYVANPSDLSFSAAPAYSASTYTLTLAPITPNTATHSNGFQLETAIPITTSFHPLMQSVQFSATNVPAGYYLITLTPDSLPGVRTVSFFFQSDSYLCPYSPDFSDYYSIFQDCLTKPASQPGMPCLSYNSVIGECELCITGFTLTNGSCMVSTACPPRFYFKFGQCLPVNDLCGDYEAFTGNCLSCADPYRYYLNGGVCFLRAETNCTDRQWVFNQICIDVSPYCQTFNSSTGVCLSCFEGYQLINSSCQLKQDHCLQNQYPAGDDCFPIPQECSSFDRNAGRCYGCILGYSLQEGQCLPIQCPERQIPSKNGPFCVEVSSLCQHYDRITGDCLTCKDYIYRVQNGQCIQAVSPLAGCADRQKLGFGECANVTLNCKTFNLKTGNCDACDQGFYIDYTGVCQPNAVCGSNQQSVNGQCIGIPDNCLSVNSLGFCTKCISSEYRIIDGQCVLFKTCLPRQYLSASGACVYVSPECDAFNPSNGQCITCLTGARPSGGFCCPTGTTFSQTRGICVNLAASPQGGSECIIPHPSLSFCLKCPNGFVPDYSIAFRCIPQ